MSYALKNLQTTGNPVLQFYIMFPEKGVTIVLLVIYQYLVNINTFN